MDSIIQFDDLGLSPDIITIAGYTLRWYSLAYMSGLFIGWWMLRQMLKRSNAPMTDEDVDDFIIWAFLGIIVGGRLGYVFFYSPAEFIAEPLKILAFWNGGMSFHGGMAGVIIAILVFARKRALSWLRIGDYIACVYPLGHMFGRLANFVNGELWGRPTDGSWGIIFAAAGPEPRHPSQLYQAGFEGLFLLVVMTWLFWRTDARNKPGLLTGVFVVIMGTSRFILEFFREPDRNLGILSTGLTMGQTLTIPLLLAALWMIYNNRAGFSQEK